MMDRGTNGFTGLVAIVCAAFLLSPSDSWAQDLSGIKCVVNGDRNASPDAFADYRNSKVFLCCEQCTTQFESKISEFSTRANHQLVLTGQFKQTKCPISGGEIDSHVTANVGGTRVSFCCSSCLKKVDDTPAMKDRAEMVFGDKAFEKTFAPVEAAADTNLKPAVDLAVATCPLQSSQKVSSNHSVDYLQGKVFFCCQKCADAFRKSPDDYAIGANRQLVETGQYVQTECPLIGGFLNTEHASVVAGIPIKLCCEKCEAAIAGAKSEDHKTEMIFEPKRFARAFKPASKQPTTQTTDEQPVR
jgi:YHS domain-containing protein